jgi:SNF2 family DNA or RNA helicase
MDDNDIVFTTYEIVSREVTVPDKEGNIPKSDSPLVNIKWKRIILDEAHRIKNHSTKANKAMCMLKAKYRIAITGTPVHNSLNDLYSLIKFIHFEPLDDFGLWKYLFAAESASVRNNKAVSAEREKRIGFWLKFLSDYLILRRTKQDKFHGTDKCIVDLPEKRVEEVRFKLNSTENQIYQKIFAESKAKVKDILANQQNRLIGKANGLAGGGNFSDVFVYLLRLRQACCHMR